MAAVSAGPNPPARASLTASVTRRTFRAALGENRNIYGASVLISFNVLIAYFFCILWADVI